MLRGSIRVAFVCLVAVALVGAVAVVTAQQDWQQGYRVTVVLRDGARHEGASPVYRLDRGQLVIRTGQDEEPRIPAERIAHIELAGQQPKVDQLQRAAPHLLVMRDGNQVRGRLVELGHEQPENRKSPYLVIFQTEHGQERRLNADQVARVYFADPATTPAVVAPEGEGGQVLRLSAQQLWTATGMMVQRGETVRFQSAGQIQLSQDPEDVAQPAGSLRQRVAGPGAPMPNVFAGALIGRIANGPPFAIGNQTSVQMPAAGQLFLGINDSNLQDNSGEFAVRVIRGAVPRRR
jgi:hypothetical protein